MAYRTIECTTWDDPWFAELSPKAKLIFLYLITNHRVTQCGAMVITFRQIEFETGVPSPELTGIFSELSGRVTWFSGASVALVKNFYRYQRANASHTFDGAATKAAETFPVEVRETVYGLYPHLRPTTPTLPIPSSEPVDPTPTVPVGPVREQSRAEQIPAEPDKPAGEPNGSAPAGAREEPPDDPPHNPDPPRPKPRSESQKRADALYERRMPIFEAYCRGLGIEPESLGWKQRKVPSLDVLTVPILDSPECDPETIEPLTRYTLSAFQWRNGAKTPSLREVLAAFPEWDQQGRPDHVPGKSPNGYQNGRASPRQSISEMMGEAMAEIESKNVGGATVIEAEFRSGDEE